MIEDGYQDFADRFNPILDVFDEVGVRFAHEVHPSEIAYDYWTAKRAMEAIDHRPAFGLNCDPSHFVWQQLDMPGFVWDFQDRIYHVDCKEAVNLARRSQRRPRQPPAVGRPAPGLGLRVRRARRRPVGGGVPDADRHRLRGTDLGRVGGRRHGPAARRQGGPGLRSGARLRRAVRLVRLCFLHDCTSRGLSRGDCLTGSAARAQ